MRDKGFSFELPEYLLEELEETALEIQEAADFVQSVAQFSDYLSEMPTPTEKDTVH